MASLTASCGVFLVDARMMDAALLFSDRVGALRRGDGDGDGGGWIYCKRRANACTIRLAVFQKSDPKAGGGYAGHVRRWTSRQTMGHGGNVPFKLALPPGKADIANVASVSSCRTELSTTKM
jgi:hypothetical protein